VPADALAALVDRSNGVSPAAVRTTAAIYLIAFGGLSVPEIVSLVLSDVQWIDSGCARIQVRGRRCPKERTVTVIGAAGRALRDYRCSRPDTSATDQFFVNEDGTPVTAQSLESELHARGRTLGVPVRVSGRALRHAYAFRFLERECRPGSNDAFFVLPKLSRLMGHYSAETVQMYVGVLHPKKGGRQKKSAIIADDDSY
jgi:integrase